MLHGEEWFPEAADFKGLVKSHVVCHAGMHLGEGGGGREMRGGGEGKQEKEGWQVRRVEGRQRESEIAGASE